MIRIAHLTDDTNLGGVGLHIQSFLEPPLSELAASEIIVVNPEGAAPILNVDVAIVHFTVNWRKLQFIRQLRKKNPLVHLILEEHSYTAGFERHCVQTKWRFRLMLRLSYLFFDQIVAVSHSQHRWMRSARVASDTKLVSIPMSRPTDAFERVEDPTPSQPMKIGAIGRFAFQKGFEDLIDAASTLDPERFSFLVAGYGEGEEDLRRQASSLPNVSFVGKISDPVTFMRDIDVLVMPSRYEAFGLTGLEARSAGRPLLAYTVDGLEDQLKLGGSLPVTPDTPAELSKTIDALSPAKIIQLGRKAREDARGDYEAHVNAWSELLESLLNKKDR